MSSVNITETTNKITVSDADATVVTIATQGPQGASSVINTDNAVNKSIVYYDSSSSSLKADADWTISTLVFGGDF